MLCFLPVTAEELGASAPPGRPALVPSSSPVEVRPEDSADPVEDARDQAAFDSLEHARDAGACPTRLVVSFESADRVPTANDWDDADSIYVDDFAGRELCRELFAVDTQEEADALLEALYEEPLMWFDASERESLAEVLTEASAAAKPS